MHPLWGQNNDGSQTWKSHAPSLPQRVNQAEDGDSSNTAVNTRESQCVSRTTLWRGPRATSVDRNLGTNVSSEASNLPNTYSFNYTSKFSVWFLRFILKCVCSHVWMSNTWHMATETRRGYQDPWNWSYRFLWATQHGYWERNMGPLEEQKTLSTTKPLSASQIQTVISSFIWRWPFICKHFLH